jgi:formate dehydrogenase major subunit
MLLAALVPGDRRKRGGRVMDVSGWIRDWPAYRQLIGEDRLGRGAAAESAHTRELRLRTATADRVVKSVCPYCAVGCGQQVYVKDEKVVEIEGDPDSPVSRGRLCPKGSATLQLTTGPARRHQVLYAGRTPPSGSRSTWRRPWRWSPTGWSGPGARPGSRSRSPYRPDDGHCQSGRRDPRQRGELPHQEAADRPRRGTGGEPGPGLPQLHGRRTHLLRARRRDDLHAGRAALRLHRHPGLQLCRVPPPVGFQWIMEAKARGVRIIRATPRYTRTSGGWPASWTSVR